jgi:hypothetical protein
MILLAASVALPGLARGQASTSTNSAASKPALSNDSRPISLPQSLTIDKSSELSLGKKIKMKGPLAFLLKAKTLGQVPKRAFHLVNPFAKTEEGGDSFQGYANLNPRPWATTIGWRPAASGFPDPMTHEAHFGFVTFEH